MATEYTINARSAVAAIAASAKSFRIYFQDTQNGIREAVYNDGKWTISNKAIFQAKRLSPLSAVSWDGGNQVRWLSILLRLLNCCPQLLTLGCRFGSTASLRMDCLKSGATVVEGNGYRAILQD
jgi:hypothetical protein